MKKYKLLNDRPPLSQVDMEKGMDFSKVKTKAAMKSGFSFSKAWLGGSIGIAAVIITAGVMLLNKPSGENQSLAKETPAVLSSNENPARNFKINPSRDTTLIFETGSIVKISAGTFADSLGNIIQNEVDLSYREFHNPGEIILAAIPMQYDSAGIQRHFESAGMFEIRGHQNGSPVYIMKDKPLQVSLVSLNADSSKFNQYYMEKDKWVYLGKDKPSFVNIPQAGEPPPAPSDSHLAAHMDTVKSQAANTASGNFVKPVLKNDSKQQFMIDVNPEVYPELGVFRRVIFEVSSKTKDFDPAKANHSWNDAAIERIGKTNEYKVTFKARENGENIEYSVIGYPVVDENDYAAAIKKYNSLNEQYGKKLHKKTSGEKEKEAALNADLSQYVEAMNRYRALVKENYELLRQSVETQRLVYRTFQVQDFGFFNTDSPNNLPQGIALASVEFKDESGQPVEPATIYLIRKGVNILYTYYPNRTICYNPADDNVMIVIGKNNTLGWLKRDALNEVNKSANKHTFKINTVRKNTYSTIDINNLLL